MKYNSTNICEANILKIIIALYNIWKYIYNFNISHNIIILFLINYRNIKFIIIRKYIVVCYLIFIYKTIFFTKFWKFILFIEYNLSLFISSLWHWNFYI